MLGRVMERVCIGGCGVTGAVTAALLKSEGLVQSQLTIWDKSRGAGGRMATSRSPKDDGCTVDLGAQYISATPNDYSAHRKYYDELERDGILKPLSSIIEGDNRQSDGTKHYVPPKGSGSLVKYYLQNSNGIKKFGQTITDVSLDGNKWVVKSSDETETYDCVVLTFPAPQLLGLTGTIKDILGSKPDIVDKLKKVEYSARFAMGMFYKEGTKIDVPWAAKYFPKDEILRFVSIDNRKRGLESPDIGPSVAVHTSVPFGVKNLEGEKDDVCTRLVQPRVHELVPELPTSDVIKCHKWRYSQVYKSYEGTPGCVVLHESPLLILAGDAFTYSKFDGCVASAEQTVSEIKARAQGSNL